MRTTLDEYTDRPNWNAQVEQLDAVEATNSSAAVCERGEWIGRGVGDSLEVSGEDVVVVSID